MSLQDDFIELPNGAMLSYSQAAAALANVAMYTHAFSQQLHAKAVERGVEDSDMYAMAALSHITEITSAAAVKHAKRIGDDVRQTAFDQGVPAMYHVMNVEQALSVSHEMREAALCGAMPVDDGEVIDTPDDEGDHE